MRHDRTFRYAEASSSNEGCRRLWIPALGRGFCAPMVDWAISMPENGSFALATRSDGCCRRTLHGIHGVVDRMQGPTGPFDRFGCHRRFTARLGCTARRILRGTSNLEKKPTCAPKRRNGCAEKTTSAGMLAPINEQVNAEKANLSVVAEPPGRSAQARASCLVRTEHATCMSVR
jgi:hypothetical protein